MEGTNRSTLKHGGEAFEVGKIVKRVGLGLLLFAFSCLTHSLAVCSLKKIILFSHVETGKVNTQPKLEYNWTNCHGWGIPAGKEVLMGSRIKRNNCLVKIALFMSVSNLVEQIERLQKV